jgi:hypothetical protein
MAEIAKAPGRFDRTGATMTTRNQTQIVSAFERLVFQAAFVLLCVACQANAASERTPTAIAPTPEATATSTTTPTRLLVTAAPTQAPTAVPTRRDYAGYPVTDTTPGGITILSKSDIILLPNPVTSSPDAWPIYAEPFYSYTVAYPPNWFLVEPTGIRKTHGIHAKVVPGLSTSIDSFDLAKAPETEAVARNPQDALHIDIVLDEDVLRPGENLREYAQRQGWYWAESVTSQEESEHDGLPALTLQLDKHDLIPNGWKGLIVLIAAQDGRVYKIMAAPDPHDTIYPEVFQQILNSFTILDK